MGFPQGKTNGQKKNYIKKENNPEKEIKKDYSQIKGEEKEEKKV